MSIDQVFAPFTTDQLKSLNFFQFSRAFHPFTCGNRGDTPHRVIVGDHGILLALPDGWVCFDCDYTQDWAHGFMADWSWQRVFDWRGGQ